MLKSIIGILILLISSLTFASELASSKLFFEYSWLYDQNCAVTEERKFDPAWASEAVEKTQNFTDIWEKNGPIFFGKVFEVFGFGFSRKDLTATLSVCRAPSYSNPPLLNVMPLQTLCFMNSCTLGSVKTLTFLHLYIISTKTKSVLLETTYI
ncbi:MAG: hypothetical protein JNM39_12920 [Bdellovibrionaceae bacterium]|nr:hypothetical protein [Pseudobdellovibrionaceae bacterium]